MNNVITLFAPKNAERIRLDLQGRLAIAATGLLDLNSQLLQLGEELSKKFDAVENELDAIDRVEHRRQLARIRKTLSEAIHLLSRQVKILAGAGEAIRSP